MVLERIGGLGLVRVSGWMMGGLKNIVRGFCVIGGGFWISLEGVWC